MARIDTLANFLTDVANAIRGKKGTSGEIPAVNFDTEIANLNSKNYKIVSGQTNSGGSLTFDSKIIAIFYTGHYTDSVLAHNYYVNPSVAFFDGYQGLFDATYPPSIPRSYKKDQSDYTIVEKIDDYSVKMKRSSGSYSNYYYVAILEA